MIDTLTLQFNFTSTGNWYFYNSIFGTNLCRLFPKSRILLKDKVYQFIGGMPPFSLFYNGNSNYLNVEVCPRLLLQRNPCEDDVELIENPMKSFVFNDLSVPRHYVKSVTLNRIDYNCDYKMTDEEEPIIYNLMSKTTSSLNKVVKTEMEYAISYTPANGYVEIMTYNKEKQLLSVRYRDYVTEEELERFRGVMRTEVRIKNRKLNYYKNDNNWLLPKELARYLSENMKKYFWEKYAEKVWFTEPFYRIDVAIKMVKENNSLTNYSKTILCDVLRRINKNGYTRASKHYAYSKILDKIEKEKKMVLLKSK